MSNEDNKWIVSCSRGHVPSRRGEYPYVRSISMAQVQNGGLPSSDGTSGSISNPFTCCSIRENHLNYIIRKTINFVTLMHYHLLY